MEQPFIDQGTAVQAGSVPPDENDENDVKLGLTTSCLRLLTLST